MTTTTTGPREETSDLLLGVDHPPVGDLLARFELQSMPGYLLRRVDSRAAALFEAHTGQARLTPRQFGLLKVVHTEGTILQSELAVRLHLDRSTLGEMLQRMVDRGLVSRTAAPADRRTSEVRLTSTGQEALEQNVAGALEAQRALLAPLPDYLRPVFLACLEMLADADHPDQPSPDGEEE